MSQKISEKQKNLLNSFFNKSHAFLIGINNYHHLPQLKTAVNDVKQIAEVLDKDQGFNVYPLLIDAYKKDIENLLHKTLIEKIGPDDRVLFYFAGHGIASDDQDSQECYIIPADASPDDENTFIPMQTLHDALNRLPCRHLLLVLDCCFSGSFRWSGRYRHVVTRLPKRIYKERFDRFVKDPSWQVITSSAHNQKALDVIQEKPIGKRSDEGMKYSPFAEAFIKGLQGEADIIPAVGGDGVITASELYLHIKKQVEPRTNRHYEFNEKNRQTPGIFPLEKHDGGEYVFLHPRRRLNLPPIPRRNPYKGLQSFEEEDTDLFYGREQVIENLIHKTDEARLIVVTGASGTGKSSVVKAGLIPELRRKSYHVLPVIRPGKEPVIALEKIFGVSFAGDRYASSEKLISQKSVLIIDQFEELITQCSEQKKNEFIDILKSMIDSERKSILKIIITVRSDFEPQFHASELKSYWWNGRYKLPPFTSDELREIIVKPAVQEVLSFEPPELVSRIIDEVIQSPGALPLISFTLSELYRLYIESGRFDRNFNENDYNKLGGVIGSLRMKAEAVLDTLDDNHRRSLRKIMLRMVSSEGGELTKKRVFMEELDFSADENIQIEKIVDTLIDSRLVIKDMDQNNGKYIEPAHEAMIKAWPTLWKWIKEDEEKIILQDRLGEAVRDHSSIKKLWDDDYRLDQLEAEMKSPDSWLNRKEKDFVCKSVKRKSQKKGKFISALMVVIIVLTTLTTYAIYKAKEARIANYILQARSLSKNAPVLAFQYAEKAYHADKNKNVMQVLTDIAATSLEKPFYNVNLQHNHPVEDALFSPSGDKMITVADKTVRLWDMKGNILSTLKHEHVVLSSRFSPDGNKILTVSMNHSVGIWDLKGNLLKAFDHDWTVTTAIFSPGSDLVLTASKKIVYLWNLQGEQVSRYEHSTDVINTAFSLCGRFVITASEDAIRQWDLQSNLIEEHKHLMVGRDVIFSPDASNLLTIRTYQHFNTIYKINILGEYIYKFPYNISTLMALSGNVDYKMISSISFSKVITAFATGTIISLHSAISNSDISGCDINILDIEGNIYQTFSSNNQFISIALFSPDSKKILTVFPSEHATVWDLNGNSIEKFGKNIISAVFSPDGSHLLTLSNNNVANLWNGKGNLIADLGYHKGRVTSAAFSPKGNKVLTSSYDNTAKLWNLTDQPALNINLKEKGTRFAVFAPGSNNILITISDNIINLLDLNGKQIASLKGHSKFVNTVQFSPDGAKILTSSEDGTAKLWNKKGSLLKNLDRHSSRVGMSSAVFSPNGDKILTASFDGTAKLWDVSGNLILNLDKHKADINSAVFSPDGNRILTASSDKTVKLWDMRGRLLVDLPHETSVEESIFSPDNSEILTLSNRLRLWSPDGKLLTEFKTPKEGCRSAIFCLDGSKILVIAYDNSAIIYNKGGGIITKYSGHKGYLNSAVFSPDGTRVLTSSSDRTVKLWDMQGNLISNYDKYDGNVYSAVFSSDGKRILSVSEDKTIKIWYTPEAIIQWLKRTGISQSRDIKIEPIISLKIQGVYKILLLLFVISFSGIAFYMRLHLYLHPLVFKIVCSPNKIFRIPIEQLGHVQNLLYKIDKLNFVLSRCGIKIEKLENAILFYEKSNIKSMVKSLADGIGEKLIFKNVVLMQVFDIKVGYEFIINIDRCLMVFPETLPTETIKEELVKIKSLRFYTCIIITTIPDKQKELKKIFFNSSFSCVIPDNHDLTEWLLSPEPVKAVSQIISDQIRLNRVSPYVINQGIDQEILFYGRDQILNDILNRHLANYLVVGGRKIGKTSLLKAIQRRYEKDGRIKCWFLSNENDDIFEDFAETLSLDKSDGKFIIQHLRKISKERKHLFLIDEADEFVKCEAHNGYKTLKHFRSLSEEGKCFFILAGFWNLYRFATFDYHSPIMNFGETLRVEALEKDACRKMIMEPMEHLNIKFKSAEIVEKIINETGQRANL